MTEGFTPAALDRDATVYVAGHRGLVGSAIWRKLESEGFTDLVGRTSSELDLKDRSAVFAHFAETKPRYVVLAAAKVGGIMANNTYPVDFLSENLQIQVNVMDAALDAGVERLLFLGSSCIYPKLAPQPIHEDALLTGHLEETNDAYAIAKISGILHIQAVRRQYGLPWISAMPTNLYGPGDNFSPAGSHVLPALIRRYDEAVKSGTDEVTNWGTGSPRREFLHVDDMADACLHLLEHYDGPQQVNVGTGRTRRSRRSPSSSPRSSATRARPTGTPASRTHPAEALDVSKLASEGWTAKIGMREGLESTVAWYREHVGDLREYPARWFRDAAPQAPPTPNQLVASTCSTTRRPCAFSRVAWGCERARSRRHRRVGLAVRVADEHGFTRGVPLVRLPASAGLTVEAEGDHRAHIVRHRLLPVDGGDGRGSNSSTGGAN